MTSAASKKRKGTLEFEPVVTESAKRAKLSEDALAIQFHDKGEWKSIIAPEMSLSIQVDVDHNKRPWIKELNSGDRLVFSLKGTVAPFFSGPDERGNASLPIKTGSASITALKKHLVDPLTKMYREKVTKDAGKGKQKEVYTPAGKDWQTQDGEMKKADTAKVKIYKDSKLLNVTSLENLGGDHEQGSIENIKPGDTVVCLCYVSGYNNQSVGFSLTSIGCWHLPKSGDNIAPPSFF